MNYKQQQKSVSITKKTEIIKQMTTHREDSQIITKLNRKQWLRHFWQRDKSKRNS